MACEYHYDCRECSEDEKKAIEEAVSASLAERDRLQKELEETLEVLESFRTPLCNTAQLIGGWHEDGTAWTEWDESVRSSVTQMIESVDRLLRNHGKLEGKDDK